jgi:hypothetical protein
MSDILDELSSLRTIRPMSAITGRPIQTEPERVNQQVGAWKDILGMLTKNILNRGVWEEKPTEWQDRSNPNFVGSIFAEPRREVATSVLTPKMVEAAQMRGFLSPSSKAVAKNLQGFSVLDDLVGKVLKKSAPGHTRPNAFEIDRVLMEKPINCR